MALGALCVQEMQEKPKYCNWILKEKYLLNILVYPKHQKKLEYQKARLVKLVKRER